MDNLIESIDYKSCVIEVYPDFDPQNPREWDNLGIIVCSHGRYELGEEQFDKNRIDYYSSFDELFADYINLKYKIVDPKEYDTSNETEIQKVWKWIDKNLLYAPLYLYDHSVLRMKIGSFYGLLPQGHAEFDSGQVGFIYVDKEKLRKEYGKRITKNIKEKAMQVLNGEIDTYDSYVSGQIYGYMAKDSKGEDINSCWGFFGDTDEMIKEAKGEIDYYLKEKQKKKEKKLKGQIKNKVALQYRK